MNRTRRTATVSALLFAALTAGFALLLIHPGGPLSVVSTHGASMLPTLDPQSLVVVRAAPPYEVGDVAAYRSDELDSIVLHRIVDTDGDRFVFQGDANDWLDTDRPTADEVIGTAWITIPAIGRLAEIPPAAWGGLLAGLLLVGGRTARTTNTPPADARRRRRTPAPRTVDAAERTAIPAVALLAAAGLVGAIAFAQPTTQPGPVDYTHRGEFSYTAQATPGLTYPDGIVATGDPMFLDLVDGIEITYAHRMTTRGPAEVRSRTELFLVIRSGDGWEHALPDAPTVETDTPGSELSVTIDPDDIHTLFDRFEDETGLSASARRIAVTAHVDIDGDISGAPLDETFTTELVLAVDDRQLRVVDGLDPHLDDRSVTVDGARPGQLEALGYAVAVTHVRVGSIIVGGLALAALTLITRVRLRGREVDELTRIRARLGDALVSVSSLRPPKDRTVIELTEVDDLVRIAQARGAPVSHRRWADTDTFLVDDGAAVYWYGADTSQQGSPHGLDGEHEATVRGD